MTFSLKGEGHVSETGHALFTIAMNVPQLDDDGQPTGGWISLSQVDMPYETDPVPINSNVILKSTDLHPGNSDYLVGSGTYLPFSISLWGITKNASLYWSDTVVLTDVQAFQYDEHGNSVELEDSQFTILSNNDALNFADFEHTTTVPIPGALWLLGSGLVGLISIRRKL